MELGFSCFSSTLAFLLFSFMLLKLGKRLKSNKTTSNLPPGPWKLPIIGNLHKLIGSVPHHGLRDLANIYGSLMHLQLGEVSTIVVSSPELAKEVMKTHDVIFASRPRILGAKILSYDYSDIIFSPYSNCWKQLRKICMSELLSAKRVHSFRSVREEEVSNLIRWISSKVGSVVNLTESLYSLMYGMTSRAAFGSKSRDQEAFVSVVAETLKVLAGFNIVDLFPSIGLLQSITGFRSHVERLHQEADRVIENIINDHKKRKAILKIGANEEDEDLIDVLLRIQEHGDGLELTLKTDNIKAVITDIFAAGSETSATTVDWAMCEMMKNPSVMRKAQAEVREIFNRKGKVDEASTKEPKELVHFLSCLPSISNMASLQRFETADENYNYSQVEYHESPPSESVNTQTQRTSKTQTYYSDSGLVETQTAEYYSQTQNDGHSHSKTHGHGHDLGLGGHGHGLTQTHSSTHGHGLTQPLGLGHTSSSDGLATSGCNRSLKKRSEHKRGQFQRIKDGLAGSSSDSESDDEHYTRKSNF